MQDESSYLVDEILPLGFSTTKGITLGAWLNPRSVEGVQSIINIDKIFQLSLVNGKPKIKICNHEGNDCKTVESQNTLKAKVWQYVAVVYDHIERNVTIFVNETYGTNSHGESSYKTIETVTFAKNYENESPKILMGKQLNNANPFLGEISCLQIHEKVQ